MKKLIALFVTSIFVFGLGMAYAEEETVLNPWERNVKPSAKKADKTRTAIKTNKKDAKKTNVEKTKKTNIAKAENASDAKTEKKETGQKKKFLFW